MHDIRINLVTNKQKFNQRLLGFIIIFIMIGVIGASIGISYYLALNELRNQETINQNLKIKNTGVKEVKEYLDEQIAFKNLLNIKKKNVEVLTKNMPILSKAFNELEKSITVDVQIISLNIDQNNIIISGLCSNHTEIAKVLRNLRKGDSFTRVKLVSSQKTGVGNEIMFKIETEWEAPKYEVQ